MTGRRALWTRRLCQGIVVLCIVEFLVATIGVQIRSLPRTTDFASYYVAAALTRQNVSPYDRAAQLEVAAERGLGFRPYAFLYPPAFALVVEPLARLPYARARQGWMLLSTLALLMALGLTLRLTRDLAAELGLRDPSALWILQAAWTAAALNSTGVHNDVRAGSVGCLLWLCWVGMAYALLHRREAAGGVLLGLATLLKLVPAVLLAWLAWQRRWTWVATAGGILLLAAMAAWWRWGGGIHADYVETALWPALRAEAPRPMNQSLDAALSRLFVPGPIVRAPFEAPVLKTVLSLLAAGALLVATARALTRAAPSPQLAPLASGLVALTLLVVMKLTWLHTLTMVLFVWPVIMVHVLVAAERGVPGVRRLGVAACVGFFLSSAHMPVLWHALRDGPAVLLISAHLVGLLVLWGTAWRVLGLSARG